MRSGGVVGTITGPPGSSKFAIGRADAAGRAPSCPLLQLTRLHLVVADAVQASQLSGSDGVVRSYDLVSITPKIEKVLHQASTTTVKLTISVRHIVMWSAAGALVRA